MGRFVIHLERTRIGTSVISGNTAAGLKVRQGGGLYAASSKIELNNSTVANNTNEGIRSTDGDVTLLNSIVYFNSADHLAGTIAASFSNIEGGAEGESIIDFNPVFDDDSNLTIVVGSPSIDTGNPDP